MDYSSALERFEQLKKLVDEEASPSVNPERKQQLYEEITEPYGRVAEAYCQIAGTQKVPVPPNGKGASIFPNFFEAGYLSGRTFHTHQGRMELQKVIGIVRERAARASSAPTVAAVSSSGNRVFLVHGHNEAVLQTAARFIEKLGLPVTILREEANKGQTVIEKFEKYSDAGFAVVLLTADDVCGPVGGEPEQIHRRARQNAILELGFFLGKLGRAKVCALYEEGVELPSDFHGVLYTLIDPKGAWKLGLARELKAANLPVDMNKAI